MGQQERTCSVGVRAGIHIPGSHRKARWVWQAVATPAHGWKTGDLQNMLARLGCSQLGQEGTLARQRRCGAVEKERLSTSPGCVHMDTYVCIYIYTNTCIHTIHTDTKHTVSIAHTCNTVHTHTQKKKNPKKQKNKQH